MARGRDRGADPVRLPARDGPVHEPADLPAGDQLLGPPARRALKIVLAGAFDGPDLERLRERLPWAELVVVDAADLPQAVRDADVLVSNRVAAGALAGARRLRLVQSFSAGSDRVDPAALPPGVPFANLHGHERAIAEWCLGAAVVLLRGLLRHDRELRRGVWNRYDGREEPLLLGRTVGLVGHGRIARELEGLLRPLGVETLAVTRQPRDGVPGLDGLDDLLRRADLAVVCIAGQAGTLFGARELDLLGPEGYLLNVARARVVDERALFEALRDGRIAGAALDVWWRYPDGPDDTVLPSELPFHELDNVLLTPHMSGRSARTRELRWRFLAEQLERLRDGRPPENVLHVG